MGEKALRIRDFTGAAVRVWRVLRGRVMGGLVGDNGIGSGLWW
jgi:hypothetical protein